LRQIIFAGHFWWRGVGEVIDVVLFVQEDFLQRVVLEEQLGV
jgi:hypothetical protein